MLSCPTSAITFKPVARIDILTKDRSAEALTPRELVCDPVFAGIPPKFLLWQQGLVLRRRVRAGQVLCRQGDPGNTAFILRRGQITLPYLTPVLDVRWTELAATGIAPQELKKLENYTVEVVLGRV